MNVLARSLIVAAVLAGAGPVPTPLAHAAPNYLGGCGFHTITDHLAAENTHTGVVRAAVVGYDDAGTSGNPAVVIVTCQIFVNGRLAAGGSYVGVPVAVGADPVSYVAGPEDDVTFCQRIEVNGTLFATCSPSILLNTDDVLCDVLRELSGHLGVSARPVAWMDENGAVWVLNLKTVTSPVRIEDDGDLWVTPIPLRVVDCEPIND
jgi:hypothetical protein